VAKISFNNIFKKPKPEEYDLGYVIKPWTLSRRPKP
jgi:hypothetical protein